MAGRKTDYKEEYCEEIIHFMGRGYSITAFAGSIKVSRQTIYDWANANPEFKSALDIARACRVYSLEQDFLGSTERAVVTSRFMALKCADPGEWKEKMEHDHKHTHENFFNDVISRSREVDITGRN